MVEFDHFRKEAGLPTFTMSVSNWIEKTGAIGIVSKAGRYGGTYAHKDIAFEFCSAISPMFKLYVIKEYQRLVELERSELALSWNVKRLLSKANYHIHTDAIRNVILPKPNISQMKQSLVYASEADLLNMVLFNCTAKQWQEANPELAKTMNIRDTATINQLIVLFIIHTQETISRGNSITELPLFHYLCPVMADLIGHLRHPRLDRGSSRFSRQFSKTAGNQSLLIIQNSKNSVQHQQDYQLNDLT